jgi:hypothetical protein
MCSASSPGRFIPDTHSIGGGSRSGRGGEQKYFQPLPETEPQTSSVVHPASYKTGTGALSVGLKRPGREADYLAPSNAEIMNVYTSTSPYVFLAWCFVKHRIF